MMSSEWGQQPIYSSQQLRSIDFTSREKRSIGPLNEAENGEIWRPVAPKPYTVQRLVMCETPWSLDYNVNSIEPLQYWGFFGQEGAELNRTFNHTCSENSWIAEYKITQT